MANIIVEEGGSVEILLSSEVFMARENTGIGFLTFNLKILRALSNIYRIISPIFCTR